MALVMPMVYSLFAESVPDRHKATYGPRQFAKSYHFLVAIAGLSDG
jgi:hypothetical protein